MKALPLVAQAFQPAGCETFQFRVRTGDWKVARTRTFENVRYMVGRCVRPCRGFRKLARYISNDSPVKTAGVKRSSMVMAVPPKKERALATVYPIQILPTVRC